MPRIVKIDRALYEVDDEAKTYCYHSRNREWENLPLEESDMNKRHIDGYTRIFPDGRKKVFKYKG